MIIFFLLIVAGLFILSFSGTRPVNLGANNGKLGMLPTSPNAVSSQTGDTTRKMEPIKFTGEPTAMINKIKNLVSSLPRTTIVTSSDDYLHAEFRSLIFRFVDDVEFLIDKENGLVHFRSASRVGQSDLGANRKRMEKISKLLIEN